MHGHPPGALPGLGRKKWAPEGAHRYPTEKQIRSEVQVESYGHEPAYRAILL